MDGQVKAGVLKWMLAALWNRYEQRLGAWASIAGLVITAGALALGALPVASTLREAIYAIGLVLLCIGGFICSIMYCIRLSRKSRYGEIMPRLRSAVEGIIFECHHPSHSLDEKKAHLAKVMDEIAGAFSILTSSSCRACIKMVRRQPKKQSPLEVVTFCRSSDESAAGELHPLAHNTDFNALYQEPTKHWFFGNNLPEMARQGAYNNTNQQWQAKYKSTLVWPIRKPTENPQSETLLVGFLCVDSKRTMPFSEEFDYPVGAMVASVLYPFSETLGGATAPSPDDITFARGAAPGFVEESKFQQGVPDGG